MTDAERIAALNAQAERIEQKLVRVVEAVERRNQEIADLRGLLSMVRAVVDTPLVDSHRAETEL